MSVTATEEIQCEESAHGGLRWDMGQDDHSDSQPETVAPRDEAAPHDLLILAKAAAGSGRRGKADRASWIIAAASALAIHVLVLGACVAVGWIPWMRLPRAEFSRGANGAETALVTDRADAGPLIVSGVPGPLVDREADQQLTPLDRLNTRGVEEEVQATEPRTINTLPVDVEDAAESPLIGVGLHPAEQAALPQRPGSTARMPDTSHAAQSSPAPDAVAMTHTFVPPRGAPSAAGDAGGGYDSNGIPVPEYPADSKRRHEEGIVAWEVLVLPDGSAGSVVLAHDSGYPRLNNAALAAIRAAHFTPALMDGVPTAARVVVPFRFRLHPRSG